MVSDKKHVQQSAFRSLTTILQLLPLHHQTITTCTIIFINFKLHYIPKLCPFQQAVTKLTVMASLVRQTIMSYSFEKCQMIMSSHSFEKLLAALPPLKFSSPLLDGCVGPASHRDAVSTCFSFNFTSSPTSPPHRATNREVRITILSPSFFEVMWIVIIVQEMLTILRVPLIQDNCHLMTRMFAIETPDQDDGTNLGTMMMARWRESCFVLFSRRHHSWSWERLERGG